ncbi:protein phosphatase PTC7 homolog [Drosophila tropicalis]|uniref:protein phosphatase PTC7 homolog n=1 Tax=Drosophila tropicalis TaxID=46794 RepID=UPI0035ABB15B
MSRTSILGPPMSYVDGPRRILGTLVDIVILATELAANSGGQLIRCLMDRTKLSPVKMNASSNTADDKLGTEVLVKNLEQDSAEQEVEKLATVVPRISPLPHPRLVSAVCGFAKDTNLYPSYSRGKYGEDAWFKASTAAADALGVADGVGGWRMYGVDPGQFSMFLMRSCERLVLAPNFDAQRPNLLISRAYCDLMEQKHPVLGSSTACILTLCREDSMLYAANIGDSGFIVVRNGAIVCRSAEQQHFFNTPFQLSGPPPGHGLSVLTDGPECADSIKFACMLGDVILLATDGVYDNVPDDLLIRVLNEVSGVSDAVQLQMSANCIALMARTLSFNPDHDSPFSQNARKQNIESPGGKPDDITVILASVI